MVDRSAPRGASFAFDAVVETVEWGRNTYTVVRLPDDLVAAAARLGSRRVVGEIDGVVVNLGVVRAPVVSGPFAYLSARFLREAELEPGEPVACRLTPADPDEVAVPPDLQVALESGGVQGSWESLDAGRRRALLRPVLAARREQTRAKRVAAVVDELQGPRPR